MERKRINSRQREALMALHGSALLMETYARDFEALARRLPHGYRDLRLILTTMDRLATQLLDTIPVDQLLTIRRHLSMSAVRVTVNDYTGKRQDSWLLSRDDVATLATAAVERCLACDNATGQGCELHRLLRELPVEAETLFVPCMKE